MIDALSGLEGLRALEEELGMIVVEGGGLGEFGVMQAERRFGGGGQAALLVVGKAVLAARGGIGDVVDGAWVRAHGGTQWLSLGNAELGNPDGYQKKGVVGEAKRIVVKRRGLARIEFACVEEPRRDFEKRNEAGLRSSRGRVAWHEAAVNTFLS